MTQVEKFGGVNLSIQDYIEFSFIVGQLMKKDFEENPENVPDD